MWLGYSINDNYTSKISAPLSPSLLDSRDGSRMSILLRLDPKLG